MIIQESVLRRLRQIRTITKNYGTMRGLQNVPAGLFWLLAAAFQLGWLHVSEQWTDAVSWVAILCLCGCLALSPVIRDYYDRKFGRVQQATNDKMDSAIKTLALFVLILTGIRIDNNLTLPISATGLALAIWFFWMWWTTSSFRTHILLIAFFTAVLSLLPLMGVPPAQFFLQGGYALVLGVLLTVGGICDHLMLVRAFRYRAGGFHE